MLAFDQLIAQAKASTKPYRYVVQQAKCRSCSNVIERELGLMCEHAPGSYIPVTDPATMALHKNAPVAFQETSLAWCKACHSPAAAEFTKEVRFLLTMYGNTTELPKKLAGALERYERAHKKEKFHHA